MIARLATSALLATTVLAAAEPHPDRVVVLAASDADYKALAIPRSYKTSPEAPTHLLVFHGGLCVRDMGLADSKDGSESGAVVEEKGTTEKAAVAPDGGSAVVARTTYVSRVNLSPKATDADDTVTSTTTLTLVDPTHPDGRWRVTLEQARWVKEILALSGDRGVVATTFVPRSGPTDVRVLDANGNEEVRVPDGYGETLRIDASSDGGFVAADVAFRDESLNERGVMVFDVAEGTQWIYGWRYGNDAEPISWKLLDRGVLSVKLPSGMRKFDSRGRRL